MMVAFKVIRDGATLGPYASKQSAMRAGKGARTMLRVLRMNPDGGCTCVHAWDAPREVA